MKSMEELNKVEHLKNQLQSSTNNHDTSTAVVPTAMVYTPPMSPNRAPSNRRQMAGQYSPIDMTKSWVTDMKVSAVKGNMRRRKKQNIDRTANDYSTYSLINLRFIIHLLLVMIHFVVLLMAISYNNWPRYCIENNWAFFVLVGLLISGTIISTSAFITYIVFEDLNWVITAILLFFYGLMFTVCSSLYMSDGTSDCMRCEIPVMRMDKNFRNIRFSTLTRYESPRYRKVQVLTRQSKVVSDIGTRLELSVAYITFILGILYLVLFSYYITRREKA